MRADRTQQWVLVERSLTGVDADFDSLGISSPTNPIRDAAVTIQNVSFPQDPCGAAVLLSEAAAPDSIRAGVYWAPLGCPTMRSGDTLELRVEADGGLVTGQTVIPGADRFVVRVPGDSVRAAAPPPNFNRDADTLEIEAYTQNGRALQVEIVGKLTSVRDPQDSLFAIPNETSTFWADSTAMTLPGDIIDIFSAEFDGDDPDADAFTAGYVHSLTIGLTDRNYWDFVRTRNSVLSGRGFANHLEGGFGVFGSMTVDQQEIRVTGTIDDPREGFYRMTGDVEGVAVDLGWELYLGRTVSGFETGAAFLSGTWVTGVVGNSAIGQLQGNDFVFVFSQPDPRLGSDPVPARGWEIQGVLNPNGSSPMTVRDVAGTVVGTVTMSRP